MKATPMWHEEPCKACGCDACDCCDEPALAAGGGDTDDLRDQIAAEISEVDGGASEMEPCGDATYEQMADAALSVVAPELARLRGEYEERIEVLKASRQADYATHDAELHRLREQLATQRWEINIFRDERDQARALSHDLATDLDKISDHMAHRHPILWEPRWPDTDNETVADAVIRVVDELGGAA